jgi:hypothetical protein
VTAHWYGLLFLFIIIAAYVYLEIESRHTSKNTDKLQKERDKVKKRQICDEAVEILGQYGYTPSTARKIVLSAYEVGGWASGYALVEHLFSKEN